MKIFSKVSDTIKLFCTYSKLLIKSWFQYRVDAVLRSLAVFLREATNVIVIYITLQSFDDINGWNINEMIFLFSLLFLTYAILIIFFTGFRDFEDLIYRGQFDRFLLRPRGLIFQVIASNADYFAAIGHGLLGIALFLLSAKSVGIVWNVINISYYILAVIGGVLIQGSIFLLFSCTSFWFIKSGSLKNFLYYNTRKFAGYPISIFSKFIQNIMIFVVPFAFVNYFPAQFLLRKDDLKLFWEGCIYITPLVGVVMMLIAYYAWKLSLKHYSSTGN